MQIYLWLSLARALRSGRRGREFESRQVDHELFAFRCGEWMRTYRVHIAVGTINAIFAWDTAQKQRSRFLSLKIASILFAIDAIFFCWKRQASHGLRFEAHIIYIIDFSLRKHLKWEAGNKGANVLRKRRVEEKRKLQRRRERR